MCDLKIIPDFTHMDIFMDQGGVTVDIGKDKLGFHLTQGAEQR